MGAVRWFRSVTAGPDARFVSAAADATEEEKMIENTTFVDVDSDMYRRLQGESPRRDVPFDVEKGILPPSRRSSRPPSSLSTEEKASLSEMIFHEHYRSEVRNGSIGSKAMLYQSALEVKFIEEAIESEFEGKERDATHVRQRIKKAVLERCDLHKPLSYITGFQPFYGCHIACVPPLLCPRPETEMWAHWLVSGFLHGATEPFNVVDMCSGTGCIGISIAKNAPHARVLAVDILPEAVSTSNQNADRNHLLAERYRCVQSDMFAEFEREGTSLGVSPRSVDILVSNPPYILPNQYKELPKTITHWESKVALVGDPSREDRQYSYFQDLCEKGATFVRPAMERQEQLRAAPSLVIEIGLQGEKVASIIERHPDWMDVDLHTDFAGQPRWVTARRR
jgi:HemK-like putative methylase